MVDIDVPLNMYIYSTMVEYNIHISMFDPIVKYRI